MVLVIKKRCPSIQLHLQWGMQMQTENFLIMHPDGKCWADDSVYDWLIAPYTPDSSRPSWLSGSGAQFRRGELWTQISQKSQRWWQQAHLTLNNSCKVSLLTRKTAPWTRTEIRGIEYERKQTGKRTVPALTSRECKSSFVFGTTGNAVWKKIWTFQCWDENIGRRRLQDTWRRWVSQRTTKED